MEKVYLYLNNTIKDNDVLVVAISGGPDSMCLLSLVCNLNKKIKIIVAHVNHNLRKESIDEKKLVEDYCNNHNLIFEYKDLYFDNFNEGIAHNKRYEFFLQLVNKYHANYLLTAHHGDDLIETILIRITRGSNLSGYVGIRKESIKDNFKIIRPLLDVDKATIIDFCNKNNIPYLIDKSNNSNKYIRNRYRNKILPILKKENSLIHKKFQKFSKELNEYDIFIKNYVDNLKVINKKNEIDLSKFLNETKFIQKRIIEQVIKNIQQNDWLDITDQQVNEVFKLIKNKKHSIDLNNNYQAIINNDKLLIVKKGVIDDFNYIFDNELNTDNWSLKALKSSKDCTNNVIRLDSNGITLPLIVRNRIDGDRMAVKNLSGHKKVKDIFIDEKIDVRKRKTIPLLVDSDNNVLWIAGVKKSKFDKNINEKYDIIIKYEARREEND